MLPQRNGWAVCEATEHDVRHALNLLLRGRIELGHAITVHRGPPRTHAINDRRTTLELKSHTFRALHHTKAWQRLQRTCIGMPEPASINVENVLSRQAGQEARFLLLLMLLLLLLLLLRKAVSWG